jgi:hypothetical protein
MRVFLLFANDINFERYSKARSLDQIGFLMINILKISRLIHSNRDCPKVKGITHEEAAITLIVGDEND